MTTATIKIRDDVEEIKVEFSLDNPAAFQEPPTGALIVGMYIYQNLGEVIEQAGVWFNQRVAANQAAAEITEARNEG